MTLKPSGRPMMPAGLELMPDSRNSPVPIRDAGLEENQPTSAVNAFRLFSKYHYPIVVTAVRPCRTTAGGFVRGGAGLPVRVRPVLTPPAGGLRPRGLATSEEMGPQDAYTMRSIVLADDHPVV